MAITASNLYLKINIGKYSGFHARTNPKQQHQKEVTFSDASFSKKRIFFSAKEMFNIRQKLDLFLLGATHILNLLTVCVKLTRVGGWV